MRNLIVKCVIDGTMIAGFVLTSCQNKNQVDNDSVDHNNVQNETPDTSRVAGFDSTEVGTRDTTFDPSSDTLDKRR